VVRDRPGHSEPASQPAPASSVDSANGGPTEAVLFFLFRVKGNLFGCKVRNQFLDPIDSQFVVDRRGEPSIVFDPVVEFSALVTHRRSTFVSL
jgi:hypothetical protein